MLTVWSMCWKLFLFNHSHFLLLNEEQSKSLVKGKKSAFWKKKEKVAKQHCYFFFLMWLAGCGHYIVTPTQTVNNSTFWHANRLKTHQLNSTSIQPAIILGAILCCCFSKLKRQQWCLVNVSLPVWSPQILRTCPHILLSYKNKVHTQHTELCSLNTKEEEFHCGPKTNKRKYFTLLNQLPSKTQLQYTIL